MAVDGDYIMVAKQKLLHCKKVASPPKTANKGIDMR